YLLRKDICEYSLCEWERSISYIYDVEVEFENQRQVDEFLSAQISDALSQQGGKRHGDTVIKG
ncbi:hypothetical protein LJC55_04395, partial [Eubacteriales bacterium OttesenSCG-928-N14]|nr:hypothetical protein [Eubacteriales bacterium OttesenSCG-928-N14]